MKIRKPSFPALNVQALEAKIDEATELVTTSKKGDGGVMLAELREGARGDAALASFVDYVEDRFARKGVILDEWDRPTNQSVSMQPQQLARAEAQSVLQTLIGSKSELRRRDTDNDGVLTRDEAPVVWPRPQSSDVLSRTVDVALSEWHADMDSWETAVMRAEKTVKRRQDWAARVDHIAWNATETPPAEEALKWAYRQRLIELKNAGAADDSVEIFDLPSTMIGELTDAESSWTKHIPFLFKAQAQRGHLNDDEVRAFLKTEDLSEFAQRAQQQVEAALGQPWQGYLEGKDLVEGDAFNDEDYLFQIPGE